MGWRSNFSSRQVKNESESPMVSYDCNHKFVFLRQETREVMSSMEGNLYIKEDIYSCEKCLEYRKIEVSRIDS